MLATFLTPEEDVDVPPDGLQHSLRVVFEACGGTKVPDGVRQTAEPLGELGTSECLTRATGQPPGETGSFPGAHGPQKLAV